MLSSDVGPGKEVGLVRAQGLPQETVLYGLGEVGDEWEGAFEIGVSSGQITVDTRGPDLLVIVRFTNHIMIIHHFSACTTAERCTAVGYVHSVRLL